MCLKLFIFREFYFLILESNVGHIINIYQSELLCTKSIELMNINFFFRMDNLHFLPNNILTRLFKELKKKILSIIFKL